MSNPVIKPLVGLAIIGALGVGLPWVIGRKIETDVRAAIAAAPDHYPYPVSLVRYERGLFSSVAETQQRFDLGPDPDEITIDDDGKAVLPPNRIVPLTLLHRISHGPRPDGLRLARFVNTVKLDGDWREAARRLFGDAEPVTLTVDLGLAGGVRGELVSPAIDTQLPPDDEDDQEDARHLQWSGIRGQFSKSGPRLVGMLDAPGLRIDEDALVVGPATINADLTAIADGIWAGTFSSRLETVRTEGQEGAASLKGIRLDADTVETNGKLTSTTTMAVDELLLDDVKVSDARLRMVLDRLGTQSLSELSRALNRYTAQHNGKPVDGDEAQRMLAAIQPSLAAAAAEQPIFAIEDLSFTAPQGKLQLRGKVQYVGDGNLDDFSVAGDVAADLSLEAPVALIDLLLRQQAAKAKIPGPDGEPGSLHPDQIAASAQASRDDAVNKGLLTLDGDRASTAITYKDGALTINGKTLGAPTH